MRRFGQIIGIKPEHIQRYEQLHAEVWSDVLAMIRECHIQNYSIFRHENTLFAYFEYVGEDFATDMAKMGQDPKTIEWWDICKPLQEPMATRQSDEWWVTMKEVFHLD